MAKWVSLKSSWKLQDVQAGLNVTIAFLCAGSIFVLVRYCWLLAARRVAQKKDVPAYSLLSLNTVGETIDVVWLLRYDIFTNRYKGLLVQCICVILLTAATLTSGFIARFATRNGVIIRETIINGSIAERAVGSIPYAEVDTNMTMAALTAANFPQTKLLEYMPLIDFQWDYVEGQWNSSWTMDCQYNKSTPIPNPRATGNCSSITTEFPPMLNSYLDWRTNPNATYYWDYTGWRNDYDEWRDWLIFVHGVRWTDYDSQHALYTGLTMRTVAIYLHGIPRDDSSTTKCNFKAGPMESAFYTSAECKLTRSLGNRNTDDLYYGANPDGSDISFETSAYLDHYGNRFRKESSREVNVTVIEGEELVRFYQAYQITKDTTNSAYVKRNINIYVRVPQISLICLIVCAVIAGLVIFGLLNYYLFVWRYWSRLDKTPQSKLDWMLHTLKKDSDEHHSQIHLRHRLSHAMASGDDKAEIVPLTNVSSAKADSQSLKSNRSSAYAAPTPDMHHGDDGLDTPALGSKFSGGPPSNTWSPQQYERVNSYAPPDTWRSSSYGKGDYNPVQEQPGTYGWQGLHHINTAYDPSRR